MTSDRSLAVYYSDLYSMQKLGKGSYLELEAMLPFEFEIMMEKEEAWLKEQQQAASGPVI